MQAYFKGNKMLFGGLSFPGFLIPSCKVNNFKPWTCQFELRQILYLKLNIALILIHVHDLETPYLHKMMPRSQTHESQKFSGKANDCNTSVEPQKSRKEISQDKQESRMPWNSSKHKCIWVFRNVFF